MERVQYPYYEWEDYLNGMYGDECEYSHSECKSMVTSVMADRDLFVATGVTLIDEWAKASQENLTNVSINRRAWLGQAICSYLYKIPERETKSIWGSMSKEIKDFSNHSADIVISHFENLDQDRVRIDLF